MPPSPPPSSFATGTLTFTAPANTTLAASTTYSVRIVNSSSSASARLDVTSSNDEDAGAASGWSIGDNAHRKTSPTSGSWTARTASIRIAIRYSPPPNTPATGAPTITGTAEIGQTLTADTSGIADANGLTSPGYTYQWVRVDGTDADISGATSSAYTLVAADVSKTIKVRVSFTDDASNSETLTSAATVVNTLYVSNINQGGDNYFGIFGRRAAQSFRTGPQAGGYTLTSVDIGSDDAEGDAFSAALYSTDASGNPDAEVAALTPPSSFAKGTLTFTAPANTTLAASTTYTVLLTISSEPVDLDTTTLDGEDAVVAQGWSIGNAFYTRPSNGPWTSHESDAIRIAIRGSTTVNYPATGPPTITGTAEIGQTLTADTSGIADVNGLPTGYTYQWVWEDGTDADISGATSSAYTLVAADVGKTIKVRVSFTDDAGYSETLTSAATAAVLAPPPGAPTDFKVAKLGHQAVLVTWTAPIDDGGSAITEYRIEGSGFVNFDTGSTSTARFITVSRGFEIGSYAMRVHAVNTVGRGPPSKGSHPDYAIDDLYVPLFSAKVAIGGGGSVVEGSEAVFMLTTSLPVLSADNPLNVSVSVSESGDMVASTDKGTKTVSFAVGATTARLSVPTVNDESIADIDDAVEFDSTVTATITPDSDYEVLPASEASVLVEDDEPHNFPYAVEDLSARPAGDGRVLLSWSAVTEQRGERISRFEYSQAKNSAYPKFSSDSRIVATLSAGEYTIEATTFTNVPTPESGIEPTGSFTLSVSAGDDVLSPLPVVTGCIPALLNLPVSGEGAWANDCKSSVPGRGWARYYSFSLAASAEVTIELHGSHDAHLYLREGSATSGTALHENNDIGSWHYIIPGSDNATTSHIVTGLTNGVPYAFRVRAINLIGPADPSNSATTTPSASVKPFAVTDLSAAVGDGQATLSWTVPYFGGSAITGFQYRQKKGGGAYGNWKNIPSSGPTTESFTVSDLRVGDHYTFQVSAVNSDGAADASNEAGVTVLAGVLLTNLSQTGGGVSNNNINNFNDTSQPFTTGSGPNIGSYTLQSINIVGAAALATLPTLTVTLEADSSGNPSGTPLCTFTNPSSWKSGPNNEFTPATQCRLDPGVKYHIAMDAGGALQLKHNNGGIAADDISADNWEFHTRRREDSSNGWEAPASASAFRMSLFGAIGLTPDAISGRETGLHATAFDEEVRLFWDRPHDGGLPITKYQYRQKAGSGDYGEWKNISGSHRWQPQHTVTGLTNGTRYTFQVRAVNAGGEAQPSNEATAVPRDDDCRQSSIESTCTVSVGAPFNGSIEAANIDIDWIKLKATGGRTYQIDLEGHQGGKGTLPDPYISGLYTKGALVEFGLGRIPDTYNDDVSPANKDARVIWTAHRDIEVWISVVSSHKDPMGMGTYTLTVTRRSGPPPLPEPPAPLATHTLLSNFNVGERRIVTIMDPDSDHYNHVTEFSQPFTTGSNSQGYVLGSIGLIGRDWLHGPPPLIVTLRSDFGGNPSSTVLATFTNSPSWKPVGPDGGLIFSIFPAPSGTTLKPNTKYHIHILPTTRVKLETVRDLGKTGGSQSDWSFSNSRRKTLHNPNWHRENNANQAVRLGVFGQVTGQQTAQAAATVRAPMIFIATAAGPAQVDLIWTTPEFGAATGYGTQWSADGETGWQAVEPPDDGGDTMYSHVGLTPETTYHYRMHYLTEDGPGEWTYPVAATTASDAWRLNAAAVSKTQVDLSWTAPEEEFTGYYVEWSADGRTGWTATDPLHSGTEAIYSHNGLTEGTAYHYRVLAVNGNIPGAWSPVVSATTEAAPNTPATGAPAISGTARVGETLTADTSGIADDDGLDNVSFSYQWLADGAAISGATDSTYTPADAHEGASISVRVTFTDDGGNDETLTSAATNAVAAASSPPLTASLENTPASHDGSSSFTFELRFSEELRVGYKTLRDHAFTVTGGTVKNAGRLEQGSNMGWRIEVQPNVNDDVTVILPATSDCDDTGAICTEDGRKLSSRLELTVSGPESRQQQTVQNSPATGAPTINGTAQVGETLTAETSGIADEDGLTNAAFAYQWQADGADISGATSDTYTLTDSDEGAAISVRVTFTDDAGNEESLTSVATGAVAAKANSPATGAPAINGTAQVGETLTADTSGIADDDGLDNVAFSYQWQADGADIAGATGSTYALADADIGKAISVRVSFTDDRGHGEELASAATAVVEAAPLPPLTASLENTSASHDGENAFTFELRFSEEFSLSYKTLRDHAFTVTGGTVRKAQRLEQGSNIGWRITVSPDSSGAVTIILPITEDCDAQGAICTEDGRKLSTELVLTVSGP